jgi:hypothetical protein
LYCGLPLPPALVTAAPEGAAPAPPAAAPGPEAAAPQRSLVVLDLVDVPPATLARALGVPPYEAALLARRGGLHLHRVLDPSAAEAEAAQMEAEGLAVVLVPETEARARPVRVAGGERSERALALRTEEGAVTVRDEELLLIVRGPIARQYRPPFKKRRVETATLEDGYRIHLHRRAEPRPVEIDAANFEFGLAVTGSARLELDAWVRSIAPGVPRDDGFRRLPPALGPAQPEPRGPLAVAAALARAARGAANNGDDDVLLLDNVEQFRFYSGWRAAVERRR